METIGNDRHLQACFIYASDHRRLESHMQAVCQFCCFGKRSQKEEVIWRQHNTCTTLLILFSIRCLESGLQMKKWDNSQGKKEFITLETQTWVMTFTCVQVAALNAFQAQSEGLLDLPEEKPCPSARRGGRWHRPLLGPDTIIVDTQCKIKSAGITPLKMLCLLRKVLYSLYNTPVQWPQSPPGLPPPPG